MYKNELNVWRSNKSSKKIKRTKREDDEDGEKANKKRPMVFDAMQIKHSTENPNNQVKNTKTFQKN